MTIFAKLVVSEEDGIRRFLYPLTFELPFKKHETLEVAIRDDAGTLLPCEVYSSRSKLIVHFAVSLEPYERRKLTVFRSEQKAPIPDPMTISSDESGAFTIKQERITTTLQNGGLPASVVYDGVEHLAAPIVFTLNGEQADDEPVRSKSSGRELAYHNSSKSLYVANDRLSLTETRLTACKSWIDITHTVEEPAGGSIISLDIPLSSPKDDEVPTTDFGLGNGVYLKVDGDAVMLEADFYGKKPYCCWQISRVNEGIQRIDYQGDAVTVKDLSKSFYFHWTLPHRSLAVAITQLPYTTSHIQALLGRNGKIHFSVVLADVPVRKATVGVVLHFLNDIPAIAAATNPASIVSPPLIVVKL